MAGIYTVRCCAAATIGSAFYSFPLGCRISGASLTRRENLVVIPYADGTKDIGDGKLGTGEVSVGGRIWAATGDAAIALVDGMEASLFGAACPFYVCQDYGSNQRFYRVHGCKSAAHTLVEGSGGMWIDIACTFSRGPIPSLMT